MSFDGFISYSHAADGRVAPAVQRGLQSLAKPWHRRRALWIFRDQTGLAVTPALWSSIRNALDSSEYFLLMASPEAAASPWVNKEIEHWVATKSPDKILPVVTDGEWRWDPERGDFAQDSTAVPAALRGVFTEEPLYLDLRWARDEGQLSLRHSRFRDGIAQLAAPMHGISKDDLEGEDVRQHRRARRLWSVGVAALALLTLVASLTGVLAVRNADRANASAAEALRQQARASEQEDIAGRSAQEADRQLENARVHEARAKEAVQETRRQERRAQQQRELADRASADAARQQANARRLQANARQQQRAAERAAKRAEEQRALARRQSDLAKRSAEESRRQKKIAEESRRQQEVAEEQKRLAQEAKDEAERQTQAAELQKRLADEAAADARRQQANAQEQQRLAEEAAEEARTQAEQAAEDARKQKAHAEQQQRIAIGRRVNNAAKAIAVDETRMALMLGAAAAKVQDDDEARGQLASLVTSTHYAGEMDEVEDAGYITDDVLLTQGHGNRLRLWKVAERAKPTLLGDLGDHEEWAISPDRGTVAAAAVGQPFVVLLDVTTPSSPKAVAHLPVAAPVSSLTFSQDGRTLLVGTHPWETRDVADLWDLSEPRVPEPLASMFAGAQSVRKATFSPDGNTVVTLYDDESTGVWDLSQRTEAKLLTTLVEPLDGERIHAMAFLRDAPILITGGDGRILPIDLSSPAKPTRRLTALNDGGVSSVFVSSDGRRLVTGNSDGLVTVFELIGTEPTEITTWRDTGGGHAVALSPDGATVMTAGSNSTAKLWNVPDYAAPQSRADLTSGADQGLATAFIADGRSMLTVGPDARAAVWDLTGPSAPVRRTTPPVRDGEIHRAAVTPDGRILATTDLVGRVRITDMANPAKPVALVDFVEKGSWATTVDDLEISPDGRTLALGMLEQRKGFRGYTVVLWNVTPGRAATRLGSLADARMPVAFSPDGRILAAGNAASLGASLWDLADPTRPIQRGGLGALPRSLVQSIAFSPDGRTVAMGGTSASALWDVSVEARPRLFRKFTEPGRVSTIVFSPDGRTVATLHRDRATLWDVKANTDPVKVAATVLVTQRTASKVRATFSPDGRTLATGAAHSTLKGTVTLWDLMELAALRADPTVQACAIAGSGLTEDEWVHHIPELPYRPTCPG